MKNSAVALGVILEQWNESRQQQTSV